MKRTFLRSFLSLAALLLFSLSAHAQAFTHLASDNFTRANERPLSGGGNWSTPSGYGSLTILSNHLVAPASGYTPSMELWAALTWPNDQYCEVTIADQSQMASPVVRGTSSGGYMIVFVPGFIFWIEERPTQTIIAEGIPPASVSVGDVMRLEVQGTRLKAYYNGVLLASGTSSTYTSGSAGIYGYGSNSLGQLSNWDAGSIGTGVATLQVTTTSIPNAVLGQAFSFQLQATGGVTPYVWSVTPGCLQSGLSLSASGLLSGTPTQAGGPNNCTFTVIDSE
jgi:hypothetical protein